MLKGGNTLRGGCTQGVPIKGGIYSFLAPSLTHLYPKHQNSRKSIAIANSQKFVSRCGPLSSIQIFNPNSIWINIHWENRKILSRRRVFCTNCKFSPKTKNMRTTLRLISIPSWVHLVKYSLRYKQNTFPNTILFVPCTHLLHFCPPLNHLLHSPITLVYSQYSIYCTGSIPSSWMQPPQVIHGPGPINQ